MDERSRSAGFSLLELLVALSILGLAMATTYRIVGDVVITTGSRERLIRLTNLADAAMNELRLMGQTSKSAISFDWPGDVELLIDETEMPEAGLNPNAPLRSVRLSLSDKDGANFELTGIVRLRLEAGR